MPGGALIGAVTDIGNKKKFRIPMASPDLRALAQADWEQSAADAAERQHHLGLRSVARAVAWMSRTTSKKGKPDEDGDTFYDLSE